MPEMNEAHPRGASPDRLMSRALLRFYVLALICVAVSSLAAQFHIAILWLPAALVALGALWALVGIFRTADDLQKHINYQALAFAHVSTLFVSLAFGALQEVGFRCPSWFGVSVLLVSLWSLGLILFSRRYQ